MELGNRTYTFGVPALERGVRRLMVKPVQDFIDVTEVRERGRLTLMPGALLLLHHCQMSVRALMAALGQGN